MVLNKLRRALRRWLDVERPYVVHNHNYAYPEPKTHEQIMQDAADSEVREYTRIRRERYLRGGNRNFSDGSHMMYPQAPYGSNKF